MNNFRYATVFTKGSTTNKNWFPLTMPMPSQGITSVRITLSLNGDSDVEIIPGIQYSDDGITWDTAVEWTGTGATWTSTQGVTYLDKDIETPGDFSGPPTEKLFVRFGVFAVNVASNTNIEGATVGLKVSPSAKVSGSVTGGPVATPSQDATTEIFTPVTRALRAQNIDEVRVSWEMQGDTGDIETRPGFQASKDGFDWGLTDEVSVSISARTENGTTYGTTFHDITGKLTPDYKYIRFGVYAINGTSTSPEGCVTLMRVDWREA